METDTAQATSAGGFFPWYVNLRNEKEDLIFQPRQI